ncbi:MAG: 30S ribosomal protein S3 [Bacillales bacterium]|jgi:small subunit ribosomal protein S3|nr:30S ribosomal protein S3 [Bacillales bacterium]
MGQKVNPVGLRIGINKPWQATWYASKTNFSKYLLQDIQIRKVISTILDAPKVDAGLSHIDIERDNKRVLVIIHASKKGNVQGEKYARIDEIKAKVGKIIGLKIDKKDGSQNIYLDMQIEEIRNEWLDATIVAKKMATDLENRASFRMVQKKAIANVKDRGALGVKTEVSGRLNGAEIARSEGYSWGSVKLHTLRSNVDYAVAEASTTYGKLGVKVWISRPVAPKSDKGE